ncbi:hypothetical protein J3R82DRAFT_2006 [Butyriboletus roseoflavus]|nr:hypothetical protein J3R82DRAFT_2006 [Butyriboletus roseoflavus]
MSRFRERLQAVQNGLQSTHTRKTTNGPIDAFLLPDRTRVNFASSPSAEILVDNVPVCTYQSLDRTAALLLSAIGTPHEHTATHVPSYPVLEIRPSSTRHITVQDAWAIVYALFVRYHERETIPVVLSPDIDNRADLCTAAFWQGAGTHGYHPRGWLHPLSSSTRHAASPFPLVQSFTRTPLVITAHPLRPPKPLPGELLYRRYCPKVEQTLEFTYFDIGQDGQVTPHLEAFHTWHNDDRVNKGWNEGGTLEQHRQYVHGVLNNPGVLPIMMSWDGELMGYLELVYVKVRCYSIGRVRIHISSQENHVATYIPGGAKEWDRGIHVLVGEERFRGWERAQAWLRSIHHYIFLADPRTENAMGEPKADSGAIVQLSLDSTMHIETVRDIQHAFCFDVPPARALLQDGRPLARQSYISSRAGRNDHVRNTIPLLINRSGVRFISLPRWQAVLISPTYPSSSSQNSANQFIAKSVHNALTTRYAKIPAIATVKIATTRVPTSRDRGTPSPSTSNARQNRNPTIVCVIHLSQFCTPNLTWHQGDDEPPVKMTKLAIVQEREEDKYDYRTVLRCWKCDEVNGKAIVADEGTTKRLTDGVTHSLSSARQSEVKAWEEEIIACEHTLLLQQLASGLIPAEGLAHCASCELTSNLWLCLTCGALGCGRSQFGCTGGNGHALAHFNATEHPACVKLGTITPEGGADIYCYACNDARLDPELTTHLAAFGINVTSQKKTEKSVTELQIEQNLMFDFSLTAEDGSALKPVFGPGTTGLSNLGNSCYMASVLQMLFSLSPFQDRYYRRPSSDLSQGYVSEKASVHWATCGQSLPADCFECQLFKLADGLLSGRYSNPYTEQPPSDPLAHPTLEHTPWQTGLKPAGFKALVGKGHAEFATMRQQDAEEFFGHFLTVLRRFNHQTRGGAPGEGEPTDIFSFGLEQRLECLGCHRVRYRIDSMDVLSLGVPATEGEGAADATYAPVPLEMCFDLFLGQTGQEILEYQCEAGCGKTHAVRRVQLATFPDVLVVHAKKFQLKNWVPTKLDIPIILPEGDLVLDQYIGKGLQAGEEELPDGSSGPSLPQFDAEAMGQLEGMGFPSVRCQKALLATGNSGAEAAMEWLFNHMEDPDIDDPIQLSVPSVREPSGEEIALLADMGFTQAQARKALLETDGDPERAVEWLFNHPDDNGETASAGATGTETERGTKAMSPPGSTGLPARYQLKGFISHKGPSVHSGHYVAHVRLPRPRSGEAMDVDGEGDGNEAWVLFNDEKVVVADQRSVGELKKLAYMYVFERVPLS